MKTLKEFRAQLNYSQRQLAGHIGISKSYVEKLEYGKSKPSWDLINRFICSFPEYEKKEIVAMFWPDADVAQLVG